MRKAKAAWFSCDPFPGYAGFMPNEQCWNAQLRLMDIAPGHCPYPKNGKCMTFDSNGGKFIALVALPIHPTLAYRNHVGLLAHECFHALRRILKDAGETKPGEETQAYMLQSFIQTALREFEIEWQRVRGS